MLATKRIHPIDIREITYTQCREKWQALWPIRKTPIEPMSAMVFGGGYSMNMSNPVYLGAFVDNMLIGVNSCHRIDDTWRSRGLYVEPEYRGNGVAVELLRQTIALTPLDCEYAWSYPNQTALNTYIRAGFIVHSQPIHDELENKFNLYVKSCK